MKRGPQHHMHGTPTWRSWFAMCARCRYPKLPYYKRYGGRGITVCERWKTFANFLADMGKRPAGKTLDRFPNRDGNYEPGNVRWATWKEQNSNKRQGNHAGENNPMAKLDSVQVVKIRILMGNTTKHEVARMFGVTERTIRNIWSGQSWKGV